MQSVAAAGRKVAAVREGEEEDDGLVPQPD